ncbi:tyrosine-type recombinase/integrase [Peribacillus sp. JNUCC 23]
MYPRKGRVKIVTGSQKDVAVLTDEQVNHLLFHIQDISQVTQRNELIVMMLLYTGVRVSELCQVRLEDIDFLTNELSVYGKGGKHRQVPLRNDLVENIREYLKGERSQSKFVDSPCEASELSVIVARDATDAMSGGEGASKLEEININQYLSNSR